MAKSYNPEMHSAEHILNSIMKEKFSVRSFSSHIEKKKSKCDYRLSHPLSEEDIHDIEEKVNQIIESNTEITESVITREEASQLFDQDRLPDDEIIRIIKIGSYDQCPCIGEHVKSTASIGRFTILSSDFNEDRGRIRFRTIR